MSASAWKQTKAAVCQLLFDRGPTSTFRVICALPWQGAERALNELEREGAVSCDRSIAAGPHVWSLAKGGIGPNSP